MSGTLSSAVWLLPVLPLLGAAVLLLAGRRSDAWGHLLGCATALASFALGVVLLRRHAGPGRRRAGRAPDTCSAGCRSANSRWISVSNSTSCPCASFC